MAALNQSRIKSKMAKIHGSFIMKCLSLNQKHPPNEFWCRKVVNTQDSKHRLIPAVFLESDVYQKSDFPSLLIGF